MQSFGCRQGGQEFDDFNRKKLNVPPRTVGITAGYVSTRGMSKLSSNRLHFVRQGHETVALAHSYFANIPKGSRYILLTVASSRSKLELVKDGNVHQKSRRL